MVSPIRASPAFPGGNAMSGVADMTLAQVAAHVLATGINVDSPTRAERHTEAGSRVFSSLNLHIFCLLYFRFVFSFFHLLLSPPESRLTHHDPIWFDVTNVFVRGS